MKQSIKLLSMLLAVFAMSFTFTSCSDDDQLSDFEEKFVGTWMNVTGYEGYVFNSDHTGQEIYYGRNTPFEWEARDLRLYLYMEDNEMKTFNIIILNKEKMELGTPDGKTVVPYYRK